MGTHIKLTASDGHTFDAYRAEYPLRREFSTLRVELKQNKGGLRDALEGFGFKVKLSSK